jgi:hypothetical protein
LIAKTTKVIKNINKKDFFLNFRLRIFNLYIDPSGHNFLKIISSNQHYPIPIAVCWQFDIKQNQGRYKGISSEEIKNNLQITRTLIYA